MFFTAAELLNNNYNEISDLIQTAKYRKVYLICDGLDEIGEDEETIINASKKLVNLHQKQYNGKLFYGISCRQNCAIKYYQTNNFSNLFLKHYEINQWSNDDIKKLINKIVKLIYSKEKRDSKFQQNEFLDIVQNTYDLSKKDNLNPLFCKMFCLSVADNTSKINNRFIVYNTFIFKLFEIEFSKSNNNADFKTASINTINIISNFAFLQHAKKIKQKALQSLLKNLSFMDKRAISLIYNIEKQNFIHQTYQEFFVAYYYINSLNIKNNTKIDFLTILYNNSCSDFISEGLNYLIKSEDKKIEIINLFINIYFSSLSKELQELYNHSNNQPIHFLYNLGEFLDKKEFLNLKFEVLFRLGRFKTEKPLDFIKFVYNNENLDMQYPKYNISKFENSILKRQCAISASFLCGYDVEIDYVKKIIREYESYDETYDLVNRSHTLIYYGDVINTEILNFKDDGSNKWENAKIKRINRLKEYPLKYDISDRIACFRLFDLATIYSFLVSKRSLKAQLNDTEKQIIINAKVENIEKCPLERELLMMDIKSKIIKIIN